ncbi:hypothetical protein B2D45_05385 [Lactobacillus hilgardii]
MFLIYFYIKKHRSWTASKRNELHQFSVIPQRWLIERSFSWLGNYHRLWRNCERKLNTSLMMVSLAFIRLLLKRY